MDKNKRKIIKKGTRWEHESHVVSTPYVMVTDPALARFFGKYGIIIGVKPKGLLLRLYKAKVFPYTEITTPHYTEITILPCQVEEIAEEQYLCRFPRYASVKAEFQLRGYRAYECRAIKLDRSYRYVITNFPNPIKRTTCTTGSSLYDLRFVIVDKQGIHQEFTFGQLGVISSGSFAEEAWRRLII